MSMTIVLARIVMSSGPGTSIVKTHWKNVKSFFSTTVWRRRDGRF